MDITNRITAIDFNHEIQELTKEFIGREWLFDEISDWMQNDKGRFFFIIGEPGIGKSAFAAKLIQTYPEIIAFNFCISGRNSTITPSTVLRSLAAQLGEKLPGYATALANTVKPEFLSIKVDIRVQNGNEGVVTGVVIDNLIVTDPKQEVEILLREPLAKISAHPNQVFILIDGLDESIRYSKDFNLVTILSSLNDLPGWVKFICTTRPIRRVMSYFQNIKINYLQPLSENNLRDVQVFIAEQLDEKEITSLLDIEGSIDSISAIVPDTWAVAILVPRLSA